MSATEASRIRNLHESVGSIITEAKSSPSTSTTPCVDFINKLVPSQGGTGDIDCCKMLQGNFTGPYGGTSTSGMIQTRCDKYWNSISGVPPQSLGWKNCCKSGPPPVPCSTLSLQPNHTGCCQKCKSGSAQGTPCEPHCKCCKSKTQAVANTTQIAEGKKLFRETAKANERYRNSDLEEIRYMNELYDVTLGHEDIPNPLEGDTRTESIYELPKRFGNKRLTESQLIDMVNSIVKKY